MRIYANINERTVRRKFTEPKHRKRPLTVIDHTPPAFGFEIAADDTRTFFVRVKRKLNTVNLPIGTAGELTAAEARAMAMTEIEAAKAERQTSPVFLDFADEFMRRQGRRWKPATRESNRSALKNHILPFFGDMRLADIARAEVQRWFDSMCGIPAKANRALPVLSVIMTQAELWDLRPQGSNPCRNMRRYKTKPRERFLSLEELKRLGFVLDHAEDRLATAAIRSCSSPGRDPPKLPASDGTGYAAPARSCPIPRPDRRRCSFRPRRGPCCMACRALRARIERVPGGA